MKLKFCGAAKIVTGSNYMLESGGEKILIDCGMFQGRKETTRLNYKPFCYDSKKVSHVLLTHAHIDHSGLLPKLAKEGFKGKVLCTDVTVDLCDVMLSDSAFIQLKDTERENKYLEKKGLQGREPLYTEKDVRKVMNMFKPVVYDKFYQVTKNIKVRYRDAGHIIGSAIIEIFVNENGKETKLVFSGDLGQWNVPIIQDPTIIKDADYVVVESTYGDRLHEKVTDREKELLAYSKEIYRKGGRLLIPSFAIERTQELLYSFNKLIQQGKFPKLDIFLDSPLAIKATEIFKNHKEYFDEEALTKYKNPFRFPHLKYTLDTEQSKALNEYKKPCVIIAGSGMATAGRIRHHLRHGLSDPKNTVLFVGYQADGTLGRYLISGAKTAKMMGMRLPVKAKIAKINSFSAHADYGEIIKWMKGYEKKPKKVFLTHGEERSAKALKQKLAREGFECYVPDMNEVVKI